MFTWFIDELICWEQPGITFPKWAVTCDFQQYGILTSVDTDEPVQPNFKLRSSKWWSVSSLALIEYVGD